MIVVILRAVAGGSATRYVPRLGLGLLSLAGSASDEVGEPISLVPVVVLHLRNPGIA